MTCLQAHIHMHLEYTCTHTHTHTRLYFWGHFGCRHTQCYNKIDALTSPMSTSIRLFSSCCADMNIEIHNLCLYAHWSWPIVLYVCVCVSLSPPVYRLHGKLDLMHGLCMIPLSAGVGLTATWAALTMAQTLHINGNVSGNSPPASSVNAIDLTVRNWRVFWQVNATRGWDCCVYALSACLHMLFCYSFIFIPCVFWMMRTQRTVFRVKLWWWLNTRGPHHVFLNF